MTKERQKDKWHEDLFMALIYLIIVLTIMFKGFSKMENNFIIDGTIKGGATKEKGLIAFISRLENSNWKYLIISVFLFLMCVYIKSGVKKLKERRGVSNKNDINF